VTPEEHLADSTLGLAVFEAVHRMCAAFGPVGVRTTASQVAFRRRRGFAYVWLPGRYLRRPQAEVVLSIALDRELTSPRFKEVVHPARTTWQHDLEVRDVTDLDDEVRGWLHEAYLAAA
jgi:hypothetical protein